MKLTNWEMSMHKPLFFLILLALPSVAMAGDTGGLADRGKTPAEAEARGIENPANPSFQALNAHQAGYAEDVNPKTLEDNCHVEIVNGVKTNGPDTDTYVQDVQIKCDGPGQGVDTRPPGHTGTLSCPVNEKLEVDVASGVVQDWRCTPISGGSGGVDIRRRTVADGECAGDVPGGFNIQSCEVIEVRSNFGGWMPVHYDARGNSK